MPEGAKGDGTLNGARVAPLATGADQYGDVVINIKKKLVINNR
jgi:hypothetical protein